MPMWGGGFISPEGEDYVATAADWIRRRMGLGLYAQDVYGTMAQWRDLVAIPLAALSNWIDVMIYEANPVTSTELLDYWEDTLGLPRGTGRSNAWRREDLRDRLSKSYRDAWGVIWPVATYPTGAALYLLFERIHQRWTGLPTLPVWADWWHIQITVDPSIWDTRGGEEMMWYSHALTPAWGWVQFV